MDKDLCHLRVATLLFSSFGFGTMNQSHTPIFLFFSFLFSFGYFHRSLYFSYLLRIISVVQQRRFFCIQFITVFNRRLISTHMISLFQVVFKLGRDLCLKECALRLPHNLLVLLNSTFTKNKLTNFFYI